MTKIEQNQLIQSFGIMLDTKLDVRFAEFEKRMDAKIDAKFDARFAEFEQRMDAKMDSKMDAKFLEFEDRMNAKMDTQIDNKLDVRLGKDNSKIKDFVEDTTGRYIGIALERLDDNFKIIRENFKTVNDRFDRLIAILENKEVIEQGLF